MPKVSGNLIFEGLKYGAIGAFAGLGPLGVGLYAASRGLRNSARDSTQTEHRPPETSHNQQDRFG